MIIISTRGLFLMHYVEDKRLASISGSMNFPVEIINYRFHGMVIY